MSEAEPARAELPLGWLPVLRAIADSPQWWITRQTLADRLELARRNGAPNAVLCARIEAMLAAKWIEEWSAEGKAAVTLSTLAAARLGCRLTQPDDPNLEPRWTDSKLVRWPRANAQRDFAAVEVEVINSIFDPQPTPDEQVIEAEEFRREAAAALRELCVGNYSRAERLLHSRPRIPLFGCELLWWEQTVERGQEFAPRPFCPVCCKEEFDDEGKVTGWHRLPLRDQIVCVRCFAWFLDKYFRTKHARRGAAA